jgi:hypothetical protein
MTARRALIAAVAAGALLFASCRQDKPASEPGASLPASTPPAVTAVDGPPVIVAPAKGTSVAPGGTVHVVVQAPRATRVMLVGPETSLTDEAAPFEFDLVIPTAALGSFPIQAFVATAAGAFEESNTVTLSVLGPTLQSMKVEPHDMILTGIGSTRSLIVLGLYSDGVERDITDPSTGTIYLTERPEVASVSPAGLVTALSPGAVNVTARQESRERGYVLHQATVSIMVMP